jgi:hypothetical protein
MTGRDVEDYPLFQALRNSSDWLIVAHIDPPEHYREKNWYNARTDMYWVYRNSNVGWVIDWHNYVESREDRKGYWLARDLRTLREIMGYV